MTEQPGMNNPFVQSPRLETVHWRDAANGLREIAAQWDAKADAVDSICGVVCPNAGPNGEPLACAWKPGHLPEVAHSWASLPTITDSDRAPSGANGDTESRPLGAEENR